MLNSLEQLWNNWEIRVLVISSLLLQIFLLSTAGNRKRLTSAWRGNLFLLAAYLLADFVATFALGYLSQIGKVSDRSAADQNHHLMVFWAPFLLLHLGGQDTITALSIEDNELWVRQLLTMISQIFLAMYVLAKSWRSTRLLVPASFMFAAGCLKYVERVWAMKLASMSCLRSSMLKDFDIATRYAKPKEEHSSREADSHSVTEMVNVQEPDLENQERLDMSYQDVVSTAFTFLETFKRIFVDLLLSLEHKKESQKLFRNLSAEKAYKVIEIELSLMYEILHTKAPVIHTRYGWSFRFATLTCTTLALSFFFLGSKSGYKQVNVIVTYILLCGAVLLEIAAIVFMLVSFWTFAALKKSARLEKIADTLFLVIEIIRPEKVPRWSNKMGQYSLIDHCLNDKPSFSKNIMEFVGVKVIWDNFWHTTFDDVDIELKSIVFDELIYKMHYLVDGASDGSNLQGNDFIYNVAGYRNFNKHRGQWALQRKGYYEELGWSVEAEFDESVLLWHIATALLFNSMDTEIDDDYSGRREVSQKISNYMLYLLVVRTPMMPSSIGEIQFSDTCAEVKTFLGREKIGVQEAAQKILAVKTFKYVPKHVKGGTSKSVLFDGCKLAHDLHENFIENAMSSRRMWYLISAVWVEMLCFAANKCSGYLHARQLSFGGEFLTVVWFMMVHLGMGEQYRLEDPNQLVLVVE